MGEEGKRTDHNAEPGDNLNHWSAVCIRYDDLFHDVNSMPERKRLAEEWDALAILVQRSVYRGGAGEPKSGLIGTRNLSYLCHIFACSRLQPTLLMLVWFSALQLRTAGAARWDTHLPNPTGRDRVLCAAQR